MKHKILLTLYKFCTCPRTSKLKFSICPEWNGTRSDKSGMVFPQPWVLVTPHFKQFDTTLWALYIQVSWKACKVFLIDSLHPSRQFFTYIGTFSLVEKLWSMLNPRILRTVWVSLAMATAASFLCWFPWLSVVDKYPWVRTLKTKYKHSYYLWI